MLCWYVNTHTHTHAHIYKRVCTTAQHLLLNCRSLSGVHVQRVRAKELFSPSKIPHFKRCSWVLQFEKKIHGKNSSKQNFHNFNSGAKGLWFHVLCKQWRFRNKQYSDTVRGLQVCCCIVILATVFSYKYNLQQFSIETHDWLKLPPAHMHSIQETKKL